MDQKPKQKRKGNIFDKILRENVEQFFLPLLREHFGMKVVSGKPLPDKIQSTEQRETDAVFDVELKDGNRCLVHLEFEIKADPQMVYRFGEYHGMLQKKYGKPIHHFLIYLGRHRTRMKNQLSADEIFHGFTMIDLGRMDPEVLLGSQVPEMVILAVLAKYPGEQTESILRSILDKLMRISDSASALEKYIKQLLIFARLREIGPITAKTIKAMPITIDIEKDFLYRRGHKEGIAKGKAEGKAEGAEKRTIDIILTGFKNGISIELLAKQTDWSSDKVLAVLREHGVIS